jgi:hypothetical protein
LHWLALSFSAQSWERKHSEKSIETAKLAAELRTASQRHAELQVFWKSSPMANKYFHSVISLFYSLLALPNDHFHQRLLDRSRAECDQREATLARMDAQLREARQESGTACRFRFALVITLDMNPQ